LQISLPDTLLIMRILNTLPEEYFEFRTIWESVPREQRSIEYLPERLTMVEMRVSTEPEATSSSSSALVTKGRLHVSHKMSDQTYPKKDYSKIRCYICHEL